jgi:hypothetical protein
MVTGEQQLTFCHLNVPASFGKMLIMEGLKGLNN